MIEWEDESVATQDELTKRLIDTVAAVVLVVIVVAGLFFA
jgi:lipopolysaccharide/colanic/teichoic acid biosynthesis glycosyltransferase